MNVTLWNDPEYNRTHLPARFFGFTEADLQEILRRGYLAADFCNPNHPPSYRGSRVWGEGSEALREIGREHGGESSDEDNIPRIISPDRSLAITVVAGNEFTGHPLRTPNTKRPRRTAGIRLIVNSPHPSLFDDDRRPQPFRIVEGTEQEIWYLLHHRHLDTIVSELSHPGGVDESGWVREWAERILLAPFNLGDEPNPDEGAGEAPPLIVPVTRRA